MCYSPEQLDKAWLFQINKMSVHIELYFKSWISYFIEIILSYSIFTFPFALAFLRLNERNLDDLDKG